MRRIRFKRRANSGGVAAVELALSIMFLLILTLGYLAIAFNLLMNFTLVQTARDAGHIYALGKMYNGLNADYSFINATPRQVLGQIAGWLSLNPTNSDYPPLYINGSANTSDYWSTYPANQGSNVILSEITYVNEAECTTAGAATGGCTNAGKWVFMQQLVIGNKNIRTSLLGTPGSDLTATNFVINETGATGYVLDASAQVTGTVPAAITTVFSDPSNANQEGEYICFVEASAYGWNMPPFVTGMKLYASDTF